MLHYGIFLLERGVYPTFTTVHTSISEQKHVLPSHDNIITAVYMAVILEINEG